MSDGGRLLWIVGVFATATLGLLAGIWIGGEIESDIHWDVLAKADLPAECWQKIGAEGERMLREIEGGGALAPAQTQYAQRPPIDFRALTAAANVPSSR